MIVVSLLLVGVAAVLLVLGLWQPSDVLLGASTGASLLAAVLLVIGARRGGRPDAADIPSFEAGAMEAADGDPWGAREPVTVGGGGRSQPDGAAASDAATVTIPHQGAAAEQPDDRATEVVVDPPDEPAVQQVSRADAERVGRMSTEVLVIDGRPRYHLPGCVHLLGRDSEPLPVNEAVELGFTPCALCEPDSALLAEARQV